jgi:uncharacterized protein (TIGR02646 family)
VIRITRRTEPHALAEVRDDRLQSAREAVRTGRQIAFKEYDIVKPDLFAMQHNKCCYCEKREEQAKYRDVEHYRPKSTYWWLAWTWENLLFACIDCNREHKRNQFPMSDGSVALSAEQSPPGNESPLVLDPSDPAGPDPASEIEFRRERIQSKERWVPHGLTERGRRTVAVCSLDRPPLLDLYAEHVVHVVRPKLRDALAARDVGDARAIFSAWATAKRALLGNERPFRALSHDAMAVIVPAEVRDRYHLQLSRPTS